MSLPTHTPHLTQFISHNSSHTIHLTQLHLVLLLRGRRNTLTLWRLPARAWTPLEPGCFRMAGSAFDALGATFTFCCSWSCFCVAGTALTLWRLPARLDAAGARLLSRGKRSTLGATFVWQAQHKLQSYISSHTPHLIHPPSCISSYISSHKPAFQNYGFTCGVIRGFNLFTTLGQANGQTLPLASSQPKNLRFWRCCSRQCWKRSGAAGRYRPQ